MGKSTVLIVDDHPAIRESLRWLLEAEGFDVITAENGVAAIRLLAGQKPEVIVTDLQMPEMGGLELMRQLHTRGEWAGILVLAMTAHPDSLSEARECGARAMIRKPEDLPGVADTINRLLSNLV